MSARSRSEGKQRASSGEDSMAETEQHTTPAPETMETPPRGRRLRRKDATTPGTSAGTSAFLKRPLSAPQVSRRVPQLTHPLSSPSGRQCLTLSPLSLAEEQRNSGAMNDMHEAIPREIIANDQAPKPTVTATAGHNAQGPDCEFRCAFPQGCDQWQKELGASRKCVSDYFGRNKRCTKIIPFQRWCRSHYQRTSYKPDKPDKQRLRSWAKIKTRMMRDTLDIIEDMEAGVLYTVVLKKGEQARLNNHVHQKEQPVKTKSKTYQAPMNVLQRIHRDFVGTHRARADVEELVDYIDGLLDVEGVDDVPHFEMLPEFSENTHEKYKWVMQKEAKLTGTTKASADAQLESDDNATIPDTEPEPPSTPEFTLAPEPVNAVSSPSMPMDIDDSNDADDEYEDANLPEPARVKQLLKRKNRKGAIQKPRKK